MLACTGCTIKEIPVRTAFGHKTAELFEYVDFVVVVDVVVVVMVEVVVVTMPTTTLSTITITSQP